MIYSRSRFLDGHKSQAMRAKTSIPITLSITPWLLGKSAPLRETNSPMTTMKMEMGNHLSLKRCSSADVSRHHTLQPRIWNLIELAIGSQPSRG